MERSKGLILIVVGLAAVLIVWQVGFNKTSSPTPDDENQQTKQDVESNAQANQRQPGQRGMNTRQTDMNSRDRFSTNQNGENANNFNRNQMRDPNRTNRNTPTITAAASTGFKIAIPEDIDSAELRILYNEYRTISSSFGRMAGRTGRTGGRGNRGGFDMGGGMMGGRGGYDMGGGMMGGRGGFDMGNMDMNQMMEMGGGMMGGMMGGMDMGNMTQEEMMNMMGGGMNMGGMNMGNMNIEMDYTDETDVDDTENNF